MVRLRTQLRRRPEEETIHRLLGLGYLARGQVGLAVRHLEIALGLIGTEAQRAVSLTEAIRLQCEAATLRLVLIRLYGRLGNDARARALAQDVQAAL
jgi:cytochrome c-type biogenesis protein CcmH/NrfG